MPAQATTTTAPTASTVTTITPATKLDGPGVYTVDAGRGTLRRLAVGTFSASSVSPDGRPALEHLEPLVRDVFAKPQYVRMGR